MSISITMVIGDSSGQLDLFQCLIMILFILSAETDLFAGGG